MARSKLELLLTADDQLTGKLRGATAALGALAAAAATVKMAIDDYNEWGDQVQDLAAKFDIATEEASVYVRLMQDYDVTIGDLEKTHKALVKNGIEPTIVAMASNIDKIRLSASELVTYSQAVDKLTEEEADKIDDQIEAVNGMKAAWQQLSRTFASEIAPVVTQALNWISDAFIVTEEEARRAELKSLEAARAQIHARGMSTDAIDQQIHALRGLIYAEEYNASRQTYYAQMAAEQEAAQADLASAYQSTTEAIWGKSKAQIMELAATHGLGSEEFQSAYATYLHRKSVMDGLSEQLFPSEATGGGGGRSRGGGSDTMRTVSGEDVGMMVSNALVMNQEMLAELIRLFENLPVVLKDISERS